MDDGKCRKRQRRPVLQHLKQNRLANKQTNKPKKKKMNQAVTFVLYHLDNHTTHSHHSIALAVSEIQAFPSPASCLGVNDYTNIRSLIRTQALIRAPRISGSWLVFQGCPGLL